jgi:hypothetical protein
MSKSESSSIQPKSIRQKQILNVAAENPGATLAEIAEQVPSVSTDHVDRVLDQYGDPAADTTETTDNPSVTQPDDEATGDSAPPLRRAKCYVGDARSNRHAREYHRHGS